MTEVTKGVATPPDGVPDISVRLAVSEIIGGNKNHLAVIQISKDGAAGGR